MINKKRVLAVIPARGGSKRLPRKNILPLSGKPLILWSIEAAKKSMYIDKYIVTSDDDEILNISKSMQAPTLKRPGYLASDKVGTLDVILHALGEQEKKYDIVVVLQPTSPLRTEKNIDEALELFIEKDANSIISVCETDHPLLWCNTLPEDNSLVSFIKEGVKEKRSQDLEKSYRINGALYVYNTKSLICDKNIGFDDKSYAYIMKREESIDIDEEIDFRIAEMLKNF
ncbi:cytidylyltransferase domain-containing protein [Marinomonas ostreistagni]|uniref:acylneuraminate cytidylyltransferase family protein n=1 Tax=Marinomonas ostreistagni TaxID=359209 RepID=UPI001950AD8E|nr:acylneuraminate cytidylyltransferase family protein [Marinomonas ostreistagni]MBM6551056.1 acylneuraminate cytidylyltransferase family protein [Marinomonas ostreistagni]